MNATHPAHPIQLVVSDIDGTLVNRVKIITPRARAAIEAMKQRGIGFAVASARPPVGLHHIIAALGLQVPVGAVNGGAIVQPDLSVVDQLLVPVQAVRIAVSMLRQQGLNPWLFTADQWFLCDPNGAHVDHEAKTIGQQPVVVDEFDEQIMSHVLKLVAASHDHPRLAEVEAVLQAALGTTASATRSQSYYLDVTNEAANKGEAVLGVARHLGVPAERILTIGDGFNDTPMFRVSGFSVAMGNATDAVKSLASVVTDSCEEEGFAKAIERYVLDGEPAPLPTFTPVLEGARP